MRMQVANTKVTSWSHSMPTKLRCVVSCVCSRSAVSHCEFVGDVGNWGTKIC